VIPRGKFNGAQALYRSCEIDAQFTGRRLVGERSARSEGRPEGLLERAEVRMSA